MAQRELDGRRPQRYPVGRAQPLKALGARQHGGRYRCVVVRHAGTRIGEHTGVVHPGGHHRHVPRRTRGQDVVGRGPVEQRVPPGQRDHVEVGLGGRAGGHLQLCGGHPDRAHDTLLPQVAQDRVRLADGPVQPAVVRVVQVHHVDPVEAEPPEAVRQRPAHPLGAEVDRPVHRAAHLRGQRVAAPVDVLQRLAQPLLGRAGPVQRCRVEVAQARLAGAADHRPQQSTVGGAPHAQPGHQYPAAPQRAGFARDRVHA